jgi:hypothetical protein
MSAVATDLMLYMSAQNELTGYATENINAIASCGALDNISTYIMLDSFRNDVIPDTQAYLVPPGGLMSEAKNTVWSDKVATSTDVLNRFLERARIHFGDGATCQKIMIFWGHGGGLQMLDEQKKGTQLARASVADFAATLVERAQLATNRLKFDIIGFDACYMCMIEAMYELRDATSFVLCSSTVVEASGYPYKDIISGLKTNGPNLGPQSAAMFIAECYNTYYAALFQDKSPFLFVCDVSKVKNCVDVLNKIGATIISFIDRESYGTSVREAILQAQDSAGNDKSYVYVLKFFSLLTVKYETLLNRSEHAAFLLQTNQLAAAVRAAFRGNMGEDLAHQISPQIWTPIFIEEFKKFEPIYNGLHSSMNDRGEKGQAGWVSMWRSFHKLKTVSAPSNDAKRKFEMGLSKVV